LTAGFNGVVWPATGTLIANAGVIRHNGYCKCNLYPLRGTHDNQWNSNALLQSLAGYILVPSVHHKDFQQLPVKLGQSLTAGPATGTTYFSMSGIA
jgi:hypothetical protein